MTTTLPFDYYGAPPAVKRTGRPPDAMVMAAKRDLVNKPGVWIKVKSYNTRSTASKVAAKANNGEGHWGPYGTWHATVRSRGGNSTKVDLFLKYNGKDTE